MYVYVNKQVLCYIHVDPYMSMYIELLSLKLEPVSTNVHIYEHTGPYVEFLLGRDQHFL